LSVGVNVTLIPQFPPTGRVDGQSLVWLNGAVAAMLEIVTGWLPMFVKVAG